MALPKKLYDCFKQITKSKLLANDTSDDAITEFQTLLNSAQPLADDHVENAQRSIVKSMYYSNQDGFMRYISSSANRVSALILWTESKRIVNFFELHGRVHLSWNDETSSYVAQRHLKPADRPDRPDRPNDKPVARPNYTKDRLDRPDRPNDKPTRSARPNRPNRPARVTREDDQHTDTLTRQRKPRYNRATNYTSVPKYLYKRTDKTSWADMVDIQESMEQTEKTHADQLAQAATEVHEAANAQTQAQTQVQTPEQVVFEVQV